jgi:hypothetical protein
VAQAGELPGECAADQSRTNYANPHSWTNLGRCGRIPAKQVLRSTT